MLVHEAVEQVLLPQAGTVAEKEKQQAGQEHGGSLDFLVFVLRVGGCGVGHVLVHVVACHGGEQVPMIFDALPRRVAYQSP